MTNRRGWGNVVAMLLLFVGTRFRDSSLGDGLRYAAFSYITADIVLRARAGYLRRRPYWTAESWRRYLKACSVPICALLTMVAMMFALEWRFAIVGESRSFTRGLWASGTLGFMLIGAGGLVAVIDWLHQGEPSGQFVLPRWLTAWRQADN